MKKKLERSVEEMVEEFIDKCTDPETGELHIGKYDHEFLEKLLTQTLQTERQRCEEVVEAEREEILNRLYQLIDGSPGQVYLLPNQATKVVGYIHEEGVGDIAYKGKAINLKVIIDEAFTQPNNPK